MYERDWAVVVGNIIIIIITTTRRVYYYEANSGICIKYKACLPTYTPAYPCVNTECNIIRESHI